MLSGEGTVFKIAATHPPTMNFPITLVQEHPDTKNKEMKTHMLREVKK